MKTRATALILGAGASKAFGLPLGSELRDQISCDLNIRFNDFGTSLESGSYEIVDALRLIVKTPEGRSGDINPHRRAAVQISDAMALSGSIDEYIERHGDDRLKAECAKLAIAKAIIEAEARSSLFQKPSAGGNPLAGASQSWLAYFLRDITRGHSPTNVGDAFSKLTIVNFNYDRCFEQFCYLWLRQVYELDDKASADIVKSLSLYHPYGRLGPLPFENTGQHISYGSSVNGQHLIQMASRIRTYSEAKEPESGLENIIDRLRTVKNLIFLGFGFHQQNLNLLTLPEDPKKGSLSCFATLEGISDPRWSVYQARVRSAFKVPPERDLHAEGFKGKCEEFWSEYSDAIVI